VPAGGVGRTREPDGRLAILQEEAERLFRIDND
jgi:hypothetical protein